MFTTTMWTVIVFGMNKEYQIKTPKDFRLVIADVLDWYKGSGKKSLVIALQGDLGVGKTTFVQEFGKILGVDGQITSPTFTIMKQYELIHEPFEQLVHIDAYRIESEGEVEPLRFSEIFQQPNIIVCVEWPEQIPSVVPDSAVTVGLNIAENEVRNVTVKWPVEK